MAPSSDDYANVVGDYKPGSVTKIRLKNFLTYQHVEFEPGPRLNMVIGANGTGKSTILCAVCLGLGGEPKLLGRADDARAFIMHEQTMATIELTLAPHPGQPVHVLGRKIDREKGSERGNGRGASTFFINGKKVKNIKEVHELVKDTYNITIDNLCTFLPQDKVGSFSGFDQQALLTETEKTLTANQDLYHKHMELIDAEKELNSGDHNVDTIQSKLDKLNTEKERFEREKERMEEREEAVRQVDLLAKKIMWLEYNDLQTAAKELKEQKKVVREEFKKSNEELHPLEDERDAVTKRKQQVEVKNKALDQKMHRFRQAVEKSHDKYNKFDDSLDNEITNLQEVDSEKNRKKTEYEKAKEKVETHKTNLAELPPKEEIEQTYKDTADEKKAAHRKYIAAKKECASLQVQFSGLDDDARKVTSKLDRVLDEKAQQKRAFFQHQKPQLKKAAQWIDSNKKNFRRPVWGPVACEVSIKSTNTAAFLEQHCPNHLLKGFVVEDKADYDLLYNEVRVKQQIPINITLIRNGELKPIQRMYGDAKMATLKREHGVVGYLDESFTAPDAVMQALRSVASVHKVLVGGKETQKSMDDRGLLDFLSAPDTTIGQNTKQGSSIFTSQGTSSKKYQSEVSRYSKKIGTRIDDVGPAKMLARGGNPREKKDLQDRLKEIHDNISKLRPGMEDAEKKKIDLERKGQEVSARATAAKTTQELFHKMRTKMATATSKMNEAKQDLDADDGAKRKKEIIGRIKNFVIQLNSVLEVQAESHGKLMEATFSSAGMRIDKDSLNFLLRRVTDELLEKRRSHQEIEQRALDLTNKFEQKKLELQEHKKICVRDAPIKDEDGNDLPLLEELQELPYNFVEDAEAALEEAEAKVNSIHDDPNAMKQYKETCEEIDIVQEQLDARQGSKDSLDQQIQHIKTPWKQALETRVHKINVLFVEYMNEVGCTGEVKLTKGGEGRNEDCDFKKWGIEIRVSFREGVKAQVLSARVQSGGERAVSTIMYLMALQEMMVAPFRAVDEINQGLDERNERLVFRRIVENATKPPKNHPADHAGQYFLITPKLLPNMVDMENEAVTPLIVMNGPFNFDSPKDFVVDDMVAAIAGSARKRCAGDDEENVENHIPSSSGRSKSKKRRS